MPGRPSTRAALIGGSRLTDAKLVEAAAKGGKESLREPVVGVYEQAGFPKYRIAADGYPDTTDIDFRLLVDMIVRHIA